MQTINAQIRPEGTLEILSRQEVAKLFDSSQGGLYELFRRCSLAVLNSGSETDDARLVMHQNQSFAIHLLRQQRGVELEVVNAPVSAFVDGEMIKGIREHLFSVLRDIVYVHTEIVSNPAYEPDNSEHITNAVFQILRNAGCFHSQSEPNLVVCWGGHSINRSEYEYSKQVGHELGLRGLDICTGCGTGAMKGPMKGAALAHAKQRIWEGRYVGISEPGIIAAEPPNPIVNRLVIMPDIEKRLEAFVRLGHGIIVFPGGVGTTEEILHLLGILLHPDNAEIPLPLIFSGPRESSDYFSLIDRFIQTAIGETARNRYRIILGDAAETARAMKESLHTVREFRKIHNDAWYFNWLLNVHVAFQTPFKPTHNNMAKLHLHQEQEPHLLAAQLRRAFSGIVAGNVKAEGIRAIEKHGPFELRAEPHILRALDEILAAFVAQGRMKLIGDRYKPCYRLVE